MSTPCKACRGVPAPTGRGVLLCRGCAWLLLRSLEKPAASAARVVRAASYGSGCDLCGEWRDRRIVDHPEWGRICEVDIREAAEYWSLL
jgi:hypothetical protein